MGLRFFRSFQVLPWVRLNVSRNGASVSLGPPGAKVVLGPRGPRVNVGLPGTGLSYITPIGGGRPSGDDEDELTEAHDALLDGDEDEALQRFRGLRAVPDAAFVAGVLLLRADGEPVEAETLLRKARAAPALGKRLAAIGADVRLDLQLDDDTVVSLEADRVGATVALAEALQRQGRIADGVALLRAELRRSPDDVRLRLSLEDLQ